MRMVLLPALCSGVLWTGKSTRVGGDGSVGGGPASRVAHDEAARPIPPLKPRPQCYAVTCCLYLITLSRFGDRLVLRLQVALSRSLKRKQGTRKTTIPNLMPASLHAT